jgi:hypothetical protein
LLSLSLSLSIYIYIYIYISQCCQEVLQARWGPSTFSSLRRWISMRRCLGERLVRGCKALRLAPAWSSSFSVGSFFKWFMFWPICLFFLIYHKKQLGGIFVKNKD